MAVYAQTVDVQGVAAFPTTPQITIPIHTEEIGVQNLSADATAQISFDGTEVHGTIAPGRGIGYTRGADGLTKVWIRESAAGAGAVNVEVIAEG